ncbi:hypothetical protein PRZ48_006483 [Zasmidium cellare]|uniref:NAD(P)-binding protein n=1 Tax=Zasmidium cellare TaxID=395010 RepID=A0ABR0EN79_ZASCE|nr:hypothetical protein PRZ48_006483 [Zasmidium cellare]
MAKDSPEDMIRQLMVMGTDPLQKRNTIGADLVPTDRHDTYDFINPAQFDMSGRTVVITGASKGCGRGFALAYAKAGVSNICITGRASLDGVEKEIQEAAKAAGRSAPKVLKLKVELTSQEDVEKAAKEVKDAFGGIDILINNAGYMESEARFLEIDPKDFWQTWQVNIFGTFLVTRAFIPLLLNHNHPSPLKTCLIISSAWAHTKFPENFAYQTSKLAQLRFTEMLSVQFPPPTPSKTPGGSDDGLLCISLHPGGLSTELGLKLGSRMHWFLNDTPELCGNTAVWVTAQRREWLRDRYISSQWDMEEFFKLKDEIVKNDLLKVRLSVGGLEGENQKSTYMGKDM